MRQLYKIRDAVKEALAKGINRETGEITDETIEALDALDIEGRQKVHNCSQRLRQLKSAIDDCTKERAEILKLKKLIQKDYDRLEKYVAFNMRELGIDEVIIDGQRTTLVAKGDDVEVAKDAIPKLPEGLFSVSESFRALKRELLAYIERTGKTPDGVKVIKNRYGVKI